jgi:uncharacterized GH25 family protein
MRTLSTIALLVLASTGQAHYHMLIPDKPSAKKGEPVTVTFQFGHPFEGELSDMLPPLRVTLYGLGEAGTDVTKKLEKVALKGPKGKDVDAYRLKFTPDDRGDYVIEMTSAVTTLPDTKEVVQDTVKVVVHVQAQKGWDVVSPGEFGCSPLTRPYGLLSNAVFQAHFTGSAKKDERRPNLFPNDNLLVEVERYNAKPPRAFPADEFITRTMKTDRDGVVTTGLPEAGWWCLTATRRRSEKVTVGGKEVAVRRRATLWVHVDKSAPTRPAE